MDQVSRLYHQAARSIAPRKPLTVSQWADLHRRLSSKGSAEPGRWRTERNPPLREPMDCLSARSPVREVVLMFPIQFGKTEVEVNTLGYIMHHSPGPVMVCLPSEVSMMKWVNQKLDPMIEETPVIREALTSLMSRNSSNTKTFKDFSGGQLYLEHAGSPSRLKSTTVRYLLVDELDEFAANLNTGDDPVEMLEGRTSAFPAVYKRMYISTPGILGVSRIHAKWQKSDQRRYYVPCPECGHEQPLVWSGLHWDGDGLQPRYACQECGVMIEEHHKTAMIARGRWVAENPESKIRGYHINALYYPIGLGPRWADLVGMWRDAQNDPARLKTFVNDRLAEPWEDAAMRAVKHNAIADRAEDYRLRQPPLGVCVLTAGVDTQDDRLEVQILGWGAGMTCWVLDYHVISGDPADESTWVALTEYLNTPLERADGALLVVQQTAIDYGGHRGEAVKDYVRRRLIRRPMAVRGAVQNNAKPLSKGNFLEVNWRGHYDKRGVMGHLVGTVEIKHMLFSWLSVDADKPVNERRVHFSNDLALGYFAGLTSETYDPRSNRFIHKRGTRNEPLDTWVYAYAAALHSQNNLKRFSKTQWESMAGDASQAAVNIPPASTTPGRKLPPIRRGNALGRFRV